MNRLPTRATVRRFLRAALCAKCPRRLPGATSWRPDSPRPCERRCCVFVRLPAIWRIATAADPMLTSRRRLRGRLVRQLDTGRRSRAAIDAIMQLLRA